jgi:dolichyldiphosphatase
VLTKPEMHGKGYGMPSSHAQFVAFFSVTLTLFLLFRHVPHPTETHTPFSFAGRFVLSLLALASAAAVAGSRIYLSYHTQKQVFVGCACGAAFALVWFAFTTYLRRAGWIDWALGTWLFRAFRVRDLVIQEDLVDSGWARWEDRRKRQDFRYQGKKTR